MLRKIKIFLLKIALSNAKAQYDYLLDLYVTTDSISDDEFLDARLEQKQIITDLEQEIENLKLTYIGKSFYMKFSPSYPFKVGDVMRSDTLGNSFIVLDTNPKDTWWNKVRRYFGKKIFNPEGNIKVRRIILKDQHAITK